jgi:hypothetical protein
MSRLVLTAEQGIHGRCMRAMDGKKSMVSIHHKESIKISPLQTIEIITHQHSTAPAQAEQALSLPPPPSAAASAAPPSGLGAIASRAASQLRFVFLPIFFLRGGERKERKERSHTRRKGKRTMTCHTAPKKIDKQGISQCLVRKELTKRDSRWPKFGAAALCLTIAAI